MTGRQLARLGRRSPRCSIFTAHPVAQGGLLLVSLRRIKTLGAPVQLQGGSSLEGCFFREGRGTFVGDYPVRTGRKTAHAAN